MRLAAIVLALFGTALASSESGAVTYSSSPFRKIIAEATVPDRNSSPLFFSVRTGILSSHEIRVISPSDQVYYQSSGTTEIAMGREIMTLHMGTGIFIPAGEKFVLREKDPGRSATYLQFLLSAAAEAEPADQPPVTSVEIYRSPSPIPGLRRERNLLSLSKVPVPPEAPCDPLHQRSGAALHYILSGIGAEFTETRAAAKGPGSVSYEPRGLAYQWSNPGPKPLIYLVFNVSPKDLPPVIEVYNHSTNLFLEGSHIAWATYCITLSMILTLIVCATMTSDRRSETESEKPRDKRWWKR